MSVVSDQPYVMGGAGLGPSLTGGSARGPDIILAGLMVLLQQQQQRYGNGEQPPVLVQELPYDGPPLRYLLTDRQVKFCSTKEDALHHYEAVPAGRYWPVPEYAAGLQGPLGGGIVRTRINTTGQAPSAITTRLADRLGLRRQPLRGPGAICTIYHNGQPTPLEVLAEPLTVQLLAGPGTVAMEITLPAVVVLPSSRTSDYDVFELQLGLFDFCAEVDVDPVPLWAAQLTHKESGYCCAIPVVSPRPPNQQRKGTSTFHITQESYQEVCELVLTRQAVRARRAAVAAAAAGLPGPSPAQAAAEAMQRARRVEPAPTAAAAPPQAHVQPQRPVTGTQEWIDEWAPSSSQQQQQQRRRQHGRGGRRGGRHGRGGGRGSRRQGAPQASGGVLDGDDNNDAVGMAALAEALEASGAASGLYGDLDPLPSGLISCLWQEVAATSLPEGEDECTICLEGFADVDENTGSQRLVTQLRCRHTYCVVCLRQNSTKRTFHQQPLQCPQCRAEV